MIPSVWFVLLAPIVVCVASVCVDVDTAGGLLGELSSGELNGGLFLASAAAVYWVQRTNDTQQ